MPEWLKGARWKRDGRAIGTRVRISFSPPYLLEECMSGLKALHRKQTVGLPAREFKSRPLSKRTAKFMHHSCNFHYTALII